MTAKTLPILDFSRLGGTDADADAFREELREATHDYGFFYLPGHGVPAELEQRLHETVRAFFALPDEDKLAIENLRSPHFRGYTRVGGELTQGKTDWREQLDIGAERTPVPERYAEADYWRLEGPNQWPSALPELEAVISEWRERLSEVALTLLRAWAQSLGAEADVFDDAFATAPFPLIKVVRYPGRPEVEPQQGVGAHKDSGVLTLLWVEPGKGGLQVEHDGEWIDAPPVPGAFVVNIGELLEYATDGYLKATVHRVISPASGSDRISIPFFFNPALDARVPQLELPAELRARARGVTRDPANPIYGTYGENALKSRLRAHPDLAAIHHSDLLERG
jgi:isopenicillin N synthase-like dioxygenase